MQPPLSNTQDAQLLAPLVAKLLYSQEQPIPSNDDQEERAPEPTKEELDKDVKFFYQEDTEELLAPTHRRLPAASVSTSQEASNIPEAIFLEEKTSDLLALLTAHVGANAPIVPVVPQPPTLAPMCAPSCDAPQKKRKRGKGSEAPEEGKIIRSTQQPPAKESRVTRAQQKKGTPTGSFKGSEGEQRSKATMWNPTFILSLGDPVMDDATLRDPQKGRFGILSKCLEKTLLLPKDMYELQSLRKCEVFLSLKRDLTKVFT